MPAVNIVEYLDWDSSFFRFRIARLSPGPLNEEILAGLERRIETQPIDCLYFLADPADPGTVRCAEANGFSLVDIRITLQGSFHAVLPEPASPRVRPYEPADLAELRRIAGTSHQDTRFYRDSRFPRDKCDRLYETWIEKSCNTSSHAVFVAHEDDQVAGYLTCQSNGSKGQIGLVAVSAAHRRRGLGEELVNRGIGWFVNRGTAAVEVVTQGSNLGAIRLYEKAGFSTASIGLWYHKWFSHDDRAAGPGSLACT
jgi:dTDP-4-amino-4,6-dideoxy-D-galactose acyltransferase